jgi:RNA polymerase sigma-70 factor (ECF subfamily)
MTVAEYNQCVDEYADGLYRFVLKNLHDEDNARDIVQETYTKLWVKVSDVSAEKVKSYLFTSAYHATIDYIRKNKFKADFNEINNNVFSYIGHYSDLSEILHEAIKLLPEDQRSVILLRDYEGYSYDEIAEITGLNESQVKVYIYRGRMFLKKYIGSIEKVI